MATWKPMIVAHRGDSAHAPENTLAALAAAVAAGADAVEFDVRLAADDVPVVIHDGTLRRYRAGGRPVAGLTSAQLAEADVGRWFHPRFAGVGVPSLDDWLGAAPRRLGLCLELKPRRSDGERLTRLVIAALRRHDALARTWLLSFPTFPLLLAHHTEPELRLVHNALRLPRRTALHLQRMPPLAAINVDVRRARVPDAQRLRAAATPVWCWTCRTPADLRRARSLGVEAIMADDPAWARAGLEG